MSNNASAIEQVQLTRLRQLSARIGGNPLLTQASTGNTSIKLGSVLWIKASGRWLADAMQQEILIPLNLAEVRERVQRRVNPTDLYERASIETAMHAVLPHPVVLHVHSVNTIAWAVRKDARAQLESQLDGLPWQWVSYVPSGLPLAGEIERVVAASAGANVFVLGNHGLVIGGESCDAVEDLLLQVEQRLAISPRRADAIGYSALQKIAQGSAWELPPDDGVHALAIDPASQAILSRGILYPCQSIFSESITPELFCSVPCPHSRDQWEGRYRARPFLIIEGCGVLVRRTMTPSQRAMMSGLAQVVQRINSSAPIHYLTDEEVAYSVRSIASAGRYV